MSYTEERGALEGSERKQRKSLGFVRRVWRC